MMNETEKIGKTKLKPKLFTKTDQLKKKEEKVKNRKKCCKTKTANLICQTETANMIF